MALTLHPSWPWRKKPALAGDEEVLMNRSSLRSSWMYLSIITVSVKDREYILDIGVGFPGNKSMAQSHDWWGGSLVAPCLLKTAARCWYSLGTDFIVWIARLSMDVEPHWSWKSHSEHLGDQLMIWTLDHLMMESCFWRNGNSRATEYPGEPNTYKGIFSTLFFTKCGDSGTVSSDTLPEPKGWQFVVLAGGADVATDWFVIVELEISTPYWSTQSVNQTHFPQCPLWSGKAFCNERQRLIERTL